MARIRIGIIGLGNAVEPHAKSLIDLADRVEVVAAASRSEDRLRAFAQRFSFPMTTDIEGLLASRDVDAVWILTPPNSHLELVKAAAKGRKHVLLEKTDMDVALAEADIVAAGRDLVARHPEVGAIVLECTNMPPYAAALREAVGLPVYDIYSMITWFHAGLRPRRFG